MPATNKTKLPKANTSRSLRTAIPSYIIQQLDLEDGDEVEWNPRPNHNAFVVVVAFHKKGEA